jgi:hypothetical protein
MAVGAADDDAVLGGRSLVDRSVLGRLGSDDLGGAAEVGGRGLSALVWRKDVEALKVGGQGRGQERPTRSQDPLNFVELRVQERVAKCLARFLALSSPKADVAASWRY